MISTTLFAAVIFVIAVTMTMTGRGGGNFYVLTLVLMGQSMHQAATLGQFILILTAVAGMIVFHKNKMIDWKLALIIDPPTDIMAFFGGYLSEYVSGVHLKMVFSGLLVLAGLIMLIKVKDKPITKQKKFGYWHRTYNGYSYVVNLWLAIPVTAIVGLASGALGISGGSFKIPLMVLFCGVPMPVAIGTSSAMVAATALMGFFGHLTKGHFNPDLALPLVIAAVLGGFIGGKFALKTKPANLKKIFAITTIVAAGFMMVNALIS